MTTSEVAKLGEAAFDHYARFLGRPTRSDAFDAPGAPWKIQILQYPNVFPRCDTFASLGHGRYSFAQSAVFVEVVVCSSLEDQQLAGLLAKALFAATEMAIPLDEGVSLGGLSNFGESFVRRSGKAALYLARPFLFPAEFESFGGGRGKILMGVPISSAEHQLVRTYGSDALEQLFMQHDVDPFDVTRASVV